MKFDLKLFTLLNEEYRSKPIAKPRPPLAAADATAKGNRRAKALSCKIPVKGARGIEVGCGRGETARSLVVEYGCEMIGVDAKRYPQWSEAPDGLTLIEADLSAPGAPEIDYVDFGCSYSVWEHLRHPFTMLKKVYELLKPGGRFYLSANLYRGPRASHRYREVFFPWPHILFTDDVFEDYYRSIGKKPKRAAWVNQLSIADYMRYFELVGFTIESVDFSITPIDEEFYERFSDILERFPRYDLERNFIRVLLRKP